MLIYSGKLHLDLSNEKEMFKDASRPSHEELKARFKRELLKLLEEPEYMLFSNIYIETRTEEEDAYLNSGGTMCPVCYSENISAGSCEPSGSSFMFQHVSCQSCGASWSDAFKLNGISDLTTKSLQNE